MRYAGGITIALLIAALLGILYWTWSASPPPTSPAAANRGSAEARALATRLAEEVKKEAPSDRERHSLERAAAAWGRDPFLGPRSAASRQAPGTTPPSPLDAYEYSGYMEVEKKRLAIISGMQYQVGDRLESGKYVIRSIEPEKVVVEDTGKREQLTLPFVGGRY